MGQNKPSRRTSVGDFPADKISELIFMGQAYNLCREGSNFELRSSHQSQKSELRPSGKAAVEVFPEGRFLWESLLSAVYVFLLQGWRALCGSSERRTEPQLTVGFFGFLEMIGAIFKHTFYGG